MQYPLVSCLCVTKKRPALLRRSIACFERQLYPSKELIILYEIDDHETAYVVNEHVRNKTIIPILVKTSPGKRLGYLRNMTVAHARGVFVCQWDDDDWYHPERLSSQVKMIQGTSFSASILSRWVICDNVSGNVYISHRRLWEGSILCKKDVISKIPYRNESSGEDTAVVNFLASRNLICAIDDMPHLYIYTCHGRNTFRREHFINFFKSSVQLSETDAVLVNELLEQKDSSLVVNMLGEQLKHYLTDVSYT